MNIVCFALFLGMIEGVNFFLHYAWKQVGVGFAESIHVGTGRPTCCPWSISFNGIGLNFLWGLGIKKENKKVKIVGKVDSKFCKENNIEKYSNFNIVQSLGLNYHTIKHAKEFISLDSYNKTMIGINSVIKK